LLKQNSVDGRDHGDVIEQYEMSNGCTSGNNDGTMGSPIVVVEDAKI
jgi:hypothetical protein